MIALKNLLFVAAISLGLLTIRAEAQDSSTGQQLAAMELTIFGRLYCKDTPIHRIERLEENFIEPSKQKGKDFPRRLSELLDRIKPAQSLLISADPCTCSTPSEHSNLTKFENGTKKMMSDTARVPKTLFSGAKRALSPLFGDGIGGGTSWGSGYSQSQYSSRQTGWTYPMAATPQGYGGQQPYALDGRGTLYSGYPNGSGALGGYPQAQPTSYPLDNWNEPSGRSMSNGQSGIEEPDSTREYRNSTPSSGDNETNGSGPPTQVVDQEDFQLMTTSQLNELSEEARDRYRQQFAKWLQKPISERLDISAPALAKKASTHRRKGH